MNKPIGGYKIVVEKLREKEGKRFYPINWSSGEMSFFQGGKKHFYMLPSWENFPNWGEALCYCTHVSSCSLKQVFYPPEQMRIPTAAQHWALGCSCPFSSPFSNGEPSCGFYTYQLRGDAERFLYNGLDSLCQDSSIRYVLVEVELAGIVHIHERGWKGTRGRIIKILD